MQLYQTLEGPTWLELCIDTEACTISISGMAEGAWGPYTDFDALCAAWPEVFAEICAPYGGPEELLTDEQPASPLDLVAARSRTERRAASGLVRAPFEALWAEACALLEGDGVGAHVLDQLPRHHRRSVDVSPEGLASSLRFVLALEARDGEVPVGGCQRGGLPDLPPGEAWPTVDGRATALLLQLDLAQLAAVDVTGTVPARGVFQLFANAYGQGTVRLHADRHALVRHPPVAPAEHLEAWFGAGQLLVPVPGFYLDQTTDLSGPYAVASALPAPVIEALTSLLGGGPSDAYGGDRVFGGDPVDWQSMGASYVREELFCQVGFAEGHVAVGWHPDDLFGSVLDDLVVGYCGT